MPGRLVATLLLLTPLWPSTSHAGLGDGASDAGCRTTIDGNAVEIECVASGSPSRPAAVTSPAQACRWSAVPMSDAFAGGPTVEPDPGAPFIYITHPDGAVGRRFANGEEQKGFHRDCAGAGSGFRWVSTSITAADLVDQAVDRARQLAPAPILDISPAPEAGGIVNLGMWLAVEPAGPSPIRVEAGALWAVAELSLATTTWDMGNGDVVTCDGPGVPIVDPSTPDEGPCGYTYPRSSADDAPYPLGVTATWRVDYRSSAGSGTAGTIDRTTTVAYDVDEIQTVGQRSGSSG